VSGGKRFGERVGSTLLNVYVRAHVCMNLCVRTHVSFPGDS